LNDSQKEHRKYLLRKKITSYSLKIFLIVLIISLCVWIGISLFSGKGRSLFFNLVASNLLNIDVKPAVLSGITDKGLKYNITSETIENYISNFFYKSNINFARPTIKLELDNGNTINIKARRGQFDEQKNLFYLKDKVELLSSDGAYLEALLITLNIARAEIYTDQKIIARDGDNFFYSKGFILHDNFNKLTIYGPIVVSDIDIIAENLYRYDIFNNIYLRTTGNVFVDNKLRIISTDSPFFGYRNSIRYAADSFKANYISINGFRNTSNSLENFTRIEMLNNVVVHDSKNDGTLKGDKYIYDVLKGIMILTSKDKLTTYEDRKYFVSVKDRFEFNTKDNTIVARGNPHLITKNDNNKNYDIKAGLVYAKLKPVSNEIDYAEIFDNIVIKSHDNSVIYADYGYLDYAKNILSLEDNVRIVDSQGNTVEGCKIILDIQSGQTKLIKCDDQEDIATTITRKQK
jgi:hypothetical protein